MRKAEDARIRAQGERCTEKDARGTREEDEGR
jgi:hypothetical protein